VCAAGPSASPLRPIEVRSQSPAIVHLKFRFTHPLLTPRPPLLFPLQTPRDVRLAGGVFPSPWRVCLQLFFPIPSARQPSIAALIKAFPSREPILGSRTTHFFSPYRTLHASLDALFFTVVTCRPRKNCQSLALVLAFSTVFFSSFSPVLIRAPVARTRGTGAGSASCFFFNPPTTSVSPPEAHFSTADFRTGRSGALSEVTLLQESDRDTLRKA